MDRIDAIKVFVVAVDEGSLAGAARRLGKSPTAVSRALAFLEGRVGAQLLHRTTRAIRLSEAGERYVVACRFRRSPSEPDSLHRNSNQGRIK